MKAFDVFLVALFEHDALPSVGLAEELDGVDGGLLKVAKADDVAEGFGGVVNAVGARVGLNEAVVAEVFIDKEGVEPRRVKAGEKHADYYEQVDPGIKR